MRAVVKKMLADVPALYGVAQRLYLKGRFTLDRAAFGKAYPNAEWICYTDHELKNLQAGGHFSQFGQDAFLWKLMQRRGDNVGSGFYVDIGANHPIQLSNSLFFEKQGWAGVAFDPIRSFADMWKSQRLASFHPAAISTSVGAQAFIEINSHAGWEHTLSGFKGCVRKGDMDLYGFKEYEVPTGPLSSFMRKDQKVDLLMVDVEGAERIVIDGVDLSVVRPRYIMIENVSRVGGDEGVRTEIIQHGYRLVARLGAADDVFVRLAQ